jgi:hypothetical protein
VLLGTSPLDATVPLLSQAYTEVAGLNSACEQMMREVIGTTVVIAIAQSDAASDDGIIRREANARFLEKVIELLARSPAGCITRMLAYDTLRAAKALRSDQAAVVRAGATQRPTLHRRGRLLHAASLLLLAISSKCSALELTTIR